MYLFMQLKVFAHIIFVHQATVQREACSAAFPPLVCEKFCNTTVLYKGPVYATTFVPAAVTGRMNQSDTSFVIG
jgi:hypothetical protein